jgi:hypothetical protein
MFSKTFKIIAPALAAAAIAAPIAQAGPGTSDPAGRTEAKGYLAISHHLATRNQSVDLAGRTEAKGYLGISNYLATRNQPQSQAPDLAGRTEAKGFLGISHYLATRNQSPDLAGGTEAKGYKAISNYLANRPSVTAAEVTAVRPGFDWGDAGIGAAMTAGIFLLGGAVALFGLRRRELSLHH